MPRIALALAGLALLPASASAASVPAPTFRQLATRSCQAFYDQVDSRNPIEVLADGRWPVARRNVVALLRGNSRLSLRTDDQLAAIAHPRRLDARWRRMIAADRAAAHIALDTADRIAAARTRTAGAAALYRGLGRYSRAEHPFNRLSRRLGLDCLGQDMTADIGQDPSAPPADRAAATAIGAAAARLRQAVVQQTPAIEANFKRLDANDCSDVVTDAPRRAVRRAIAFESFELLWALYGPLEPAMQQFVADLDAARTVDPALVAGRALLVRWGSQVAALPPAPADGCGVLKAWRAKGWAPSAAPAVPAFLIERQPDADNVDRIATATARRLRLLGVSPYRIRLLFGDALFGGISD